MGCWKGRDVAKKVEREAVKEGMRNTWERRYSGERRRRGEREHKTRFV